MGVMKVEECRLYCMFCLFASRLGDFLWFKVRS